MLPCAKILPITFLWCVLFGITAPNWKLCKTIHQSKESIKGYLIKMFTFLVLSEAVWGCLITGGNSVRNPFNWLWILGLIVRAPYSNFGEACQQGTMLWPSTYKDGITNNLVDLGGVYMTPGRLSCRDKFTPVPSHGSTFVYMIPPQKSCRRESPRREFTPVVAPGREFHSSTKSRNGIM